MAAIPEPIALIGFGEVGAILAGELAARGAKRIRAYDPLFAKPRSKPSLAIAGLGAAAADAPDDAVMGAQLVISAVTAAQAVAAARSTASSVGSGAWFLDLNSASPGAKAEAARIIEAAGAHYVEAAVMSPVPGKGLKTPMLLGGPRAQAFLAFAAPLELNAKVFSDIVGKASAAKMCRSVMIKGTEALLAECLLTARHYGVEETVLASLSDMLPNPDWKKQSAYMISRALIHGRRRAEEMREVARTVEEAGLHPWMSGATAEVQDWAWPVNQAMGDGAAEEPLEQLLDSMRAALA